MLFRIIILQLLLFGSTNGSFSFDYTPLNEELSYNGITNLIWNYTTDETVFVIEWYKQPGVLIARIFGVNIGAPVTVFAPYNAAPYSVTLYEPSKYNAAIRITGLTSVDSGVYSVNITAASPQSSILHRKFVRLFSFDYIPLKEEFSCNGTTNLIWNYTTDEYITVIKWYKQPGVLIARIFGVYTGAPITVLPPYNAAPYSVTLYEPSKYNAAIRITGVTSADSGQYSCNVYIAAGPQSAILHRQFVPALTEKPYVVSEGSKLSCHAPRDAINVSVSWNNTNECCLTGGNADCATAPLCYSFGETTAISGSNKIIQWRITALPQRDANVSVLHPSGHTLFTVQGSLVKRFVNRVTNTSNTNITTGHIEFTLANVTVEDAGYYDTESYIPGEGSHRSTGVAMVVYGTHMKSVPKILSCTIDDKVPNGRTSEIDSFVNGMPETIRSPALLSKWNVKVISLFLDCVLVLF